ncbi:MAG: dTDP-4-dehydrorhamnose 3,5-epimerase family protein [Candidatus Omnitrophica bacterium]|nr:dTDP-4-dehydrorhamnose 3,5-epimerase family protein [Candidatus Omnitrophota bacterium]
MIQGVKAKKLKVIPDSRGRLMEILRSDDEIFTEFGQVYITTAYPKIVKAWHYHKFQTDNFTCISGKIKLVLYDSRGGSPTFKEINEWTLSLDSPQLIQIPAEVYHGFKCLADKESIVINIISRPYNHQNPDEFRVDPYKNDINFDWRKI